MKQFLLFIGILFLLTSCSEREWKNIYDPDSTDPAEWAPKTLVARQISDVEVRLAWEHFDERIDGFHLNRIIGNNEPESYYRSFSPETRYWKDTIYTIGQNQQYEIFAYADQAISASMSLDFKSVFEGPAVDGAIHKSATEATIFWQFHEFATVTEYIIQRSENSGPFLQIKQVSGNEFIDSTLSQANEYCYRIKAVTADNVSNPGDTLGIEWGQAGYEQHWDNAQDYNYGVSSSDGQYIACWGQYDISLFDAETGNRLWTADPGAYIPNYMIISSDNQYIASYNYGNSFSVRSMNDGSLAWEGAHENSPNNRVLQIAFSPDGSNIASGDTKEGAVNLWTSAGASVWTHTITGSVTKLTFSEDNNIVAAGSDSGQVVLLDVLTGDVLKTMEMTDGIASLAFSHDGNYLAISLADNNNYKYSVVIKDLDSDAALLSGEHQWLAKSIEFSDDDQYFLSSSYEDSTKVWNVISGEHLFTCYGGPPAEFNAAGDKIICGGEIGLCVYTVPEGRYYWQPDSTDYTWSVGFVGGSERIFSGGMLGAMLYRESMGWREAE